MFQNTYIVFCRGSFSSRTLTHYFHIALCLVFQQQNTYILLSYCFVFGVSAAKHTLLSYCFVFGVSAAEHLHITFILLCIWCFSILLCVWCFSSKAHITFILLCIWCFNSRTLTHYFHIALCLVFQLQNTYVLLPYCFVFGVSAAEHLHITSILLCIWCFSNRTLTHYFHIALRLVFQLQNTYTLLPYCFAFGVSATEHLHITFILLCVWCFSNKTLKLPHHCMWFFQQQNTLCTGICLCFLFLVAEHLQVQHSAIKMLHSRIKLILQYISAVEKGEFLS